MVPMAQKGLHRQRYGKNNTLDSQGVFLHSPVPLGNATALCKVLEP